MNAESALHHEITRLKAKNRKLKEGTMNAALTLLKSAGLKQFEVKRLVQNIARFDPNWDDEAMIAALAGRFYEEDITPKNEEKVGLIAQGLKTLLSLYSRRDRILDDQKTIVNFFPH